MTSWRSFHVFYSDIDRLILDCVQPAFSEIEPQLSRRFWERHYAGGPHLRIRLQGDTEALAHAGGRLAGRIAAFLAGHPSRDFEGYDAGRAAKLLEWEGVSATPETDLRYRNNRLEEQAYPPAADAFVSAEAARLMEDFRHDSLPLAVRLLRGPRPLREAVLRLYFLHALVAGGELGQGSVSFKSHWEGFASSFRSAEAIERIRAAYVANREEIALHLREVCELFTAGRIEEDAELGGWLALLTEYETRARGILLTGVHITPQADSPEMAAALRRKTESSLLRDSEFVRAFWSSDVFVASIQFETGFLIPRVLTNLLYALMGSAGLKPIDKFALCHFASRAVEEHLGCDLTQLLKATVGRLAARNASRWNSVAGR